MDALPKVGRRIQGLNAQHIPHLLKANTCPCCNLPFNENEEEWSHIVLSCSYFAQLRRTKLGYSLHILNKYLKGSPNINHHIYVLLLGGILRQMYPDSYASHLKDKNDVQEYKYGSTELTNWINGYGHLPHFYPKGFSTHGYVPLASFLQEAVPMFEKTLFNEGLLMSPSAEVEEIPEGSSAVAWVDNTITTNCTSTRARPEGMPTRPQGSSSEGSPCQGRRGL
jgi:hypothetical protein